MFFLYIFSTLLADSLYNESWFLVFLGLEAKHLLVCQIFCWGNAFVGLFLREFWSFISAVHDMFLLLKGIEPLRLPWKGNVLPLDERSMYFRRGSVAPSSFLLSAEKKRISFSSPEAILEERVLPCYGVVGFFRLPLTHYETKDYLRASFFGLHPLKTWGKEETRRCICKPFVFKKRSRSRAGETLL